MNGPTAESTTASSCTMDGTNHRALLEALCDGASDAPPLTEASHGSAPVTVLEHPNPPSGACAEGDDAAFDLEVVTVGDVGSQHERDEQSQQAWQAQGREEGEEVPRLDWRKGRTSPVQHSGDLRIACGGRIWTTACAVDDAEPISAADSVAQLLRLPKIDGVAETEYVQRAEQQRTVAIVCSNCTPRIRRKRKKPSLKLKRNDAAGASALAPAKMDVTEIVLQTLRARRQLIYGTQLYITLARPAQAVHVPSCSIRDVWCLAAAHVASRPVEAAVPQALWLLEPCRVADLINTLDKDHNGFIVRHELADGASGRFVLSAHP